MSINIILADDHVLFRDGFALLFQQFESGACCLTCGTLKDALSLLENHGDADLLFLDLNMPGMRGADSIEEVHRIHPGLPIIILSGEESRAQMTALLAAGAAGYIPKSSSAVVMISAIRLVLAGGIYVPSQLLGNASAGSYRNTVTDLETQLTERQTDVLRLLAAGKPNKTICRELQMREGTVKAHINAIYRNLGVVNRTEAALAAQRCACSGKPLRRLPTAATPSPANCQNAHRYCSH